MCCIPLGVPWLLIGACYWPIRGFRHCLNPADGEWYQFNDARVSLSSAEAVSKLQAYILFYEKS